MKWNEPPRKQHADSQPIEAQIRQVMAVNVMTRTRPTKSNVILSTWPAIINNPASQSYVPHSNRRQNKCPLLDAQICGRL